MRAANGNLPLTSAALVWVLILQVLPVWAGPFRSWSFQHPSSRMEWNTQHPIRILVEETLERAGQYDGIVIGIPDNDENDHGSTGSETATQTDNLLGWLFHQVDAKYAGILSKWVEDASTTKTTSTSTGTTSSSSNSRTRKKKNSKKKEDWEEVSKVCKVSLDGDMLVQRLVICRIKADNARATGRAIGSKLASVMKNDGEKWAFLLPSIPPLLHQQRNQSVGVHTHSDFLSEMTSTLWSDLYKDNRFKSNDKKAKRKMAENNAPFALDLIWDHPSPTPTTPTVFLEKAREAIAKGERIAEGVFLAKDIVNAPHNYLNSLSLAETARRLAAEYPRLSCHILNYEDCERLGMGAFLGVARGSETEPQFIHLVYRPPRCKIGRKNRKLGIVGKGLLFDTGGYNIKRGMMELMKFDCGGAAAILGAARAIAQLEPKQVEVHFVVAACENMVNERAMVPGDILTASNGKTIEVLNTDAEGRLTMADALVYVDQKLGCEEIIELSTLTGSCMVALGKRVAGLWCKNDALVATLMSASEGTGEKVWRMPLEQEYKEGLKSKFADINNLGGKHAGSISAALFLHEFVDEDTSFCHIDMAGPVWATKSGATGWGAKLVTEWICQSALRHQEGLDGKGTQTKP